jgi:hypothetical protein
VASSRFYLQRHGVEPGDLPTVGHFDPQYLVLKLALDSNLWTATSEWSGSTRESPRHWIYPIPTTA